jgi:hypothetical protein
MASKNTRTRISTPIEFCYAFLHEVVEGAPGWNILRANHERHTVLYRYHAGALANPVLVTVSLSPVSVGQTHMIITAQSDGLFDPFGFLNNAINNFLQHFEKKKANLARKAEAAICDAVSSGLLCPECGQPIPAGARFCPRDGTAITTECQKCGQANVPGASFCMNCGEKL